MKITTKINSMIIESERHMLCLQFDERGNDHWSLAEQDYDGVEGESKELSDDDIETMFEWALNKP